MSNLINLRLSRHEVIKLMLACSGNAICCDKVESKEGWRALHDKIEQQLGDQEDRLGE